MIDTEKSELKSATDNPWYLLATIYGEQTGVSINEDLAKLNRTAWNRWFSTVLGLGKRIRLRDSGVEGLEELNHDEQMALQKMYTTRAGREDAPLPSPNEIVDFSHTHFEGNLFFRGFLFVKPALFRGAIFSKRADFRGVTFSEGTNFRDAKFFGAAAFHEVTFSRADFRGAMFSVAANFRGATFSGNTYFEGATFSGNALFTTTKFSHADFKKVTFSETALFYEAKFSDVTRFLGVTFSGTVNFGNAKFCARTVFANAIYSGPLGQDNNASSLRG